MMFVGGSPQEIIKHQQEMHERAHASAQELRASVDRMIDEMPAEHSYTLLRLFEHIAHGDASTIHFFVGQLTAVLRVVHCVCLTCGSTQHTTWLHGMEVPVEDPHDSHGPGAFPVDCERCAHEAFDQSFELERWRRGETDA